MKEVESLFQKAGRSFAASELLLGAGDADFAASRAYYGCFYVAEALLLSRGMSFSRHGQVIARFGEHFVKEGIVERRFHRLLDQAFELRQLGDYATELGVVDPEEVRQVIAEGREFLEAAKGYLAVEEDRPTGEPRDDERSSQD